MRLCVFLEIGFVVMMMVGVSWKGVEDKKVWHMRLTWGTESQHVARCTLPHVSLCLTEVDLSQLTNRAFLRHVTTSAGRERETVGCWALADEW